VGAELLIAVRQRVRERSASRPLYLWVLEGNTRARRFYERHGAQPADHRIAELVPGIHVPELRYEWKNP
jgi:GNAT superfamily N-acetyltransferase